MGRLTENSILSIKNKSYSITADIDVPKSGAEGVIIAQGGSTNGWSLYAKGGKLKYCYNFFGITLTSSRPPSRFQRAISGAHGIRVRRRRPRQGRGRDALLDGKQAAMAASSSRCQWPTPQTRPATSARKLVARVTGLRSVRQRIQRRGNWVQIDLEKDDEDHLVSPEERYRVAMARQ